MKVLPGQESYTSEEQRRLQMLVADAADGDPGEQEEPRYVQVLCGCGWGSLAMLESSIPEFCPLCGNRLCQTGREVE